MPMLPIRRIEILEGDVNALRQLPEQVSAVAADLAALRGDFTQLRGDVTQVQGDVAQLKRDMRLEFAAVRDEIRAGDEETRSQMRILHEEVISRLALLAEGRKNAPSP